MCRFINTVCHACKKRGHIVRVCRSKAQPGRPVRKVNYIVETEEDEVSDLEPSDLKLKSYSGQLIKVIRTAAGCLVTYEQEQSELFVQVVEGEGPDLIGRDWMAALKVTLSMGDSGGSEVTTRGTCKVFLYIHRGVGVPKRDGSKTKC